MVVGNSTHPCWVVNAKLGSNVSPVFAVMMVDWYVTGSPSSQAMSAQKQWMSASWSGVCDSWLAWERRWMWDHHFWTVLLMSCHIMDVAHGVEAVCATLAIACFNPKHLWYGSLFTGLYELWKTGRYRSYPPDVLVDLVARILALVPPWTRVYRVQR